MNTDALIIGGGLAGLAAAYEVAARGRKTVIVDEAWSLGGQLRQQTQVPEAMPAPLRGLRGFQMADALTDRLKGLPVDYLLQHEMIGLYADGSVGVSNGREVTRITPAAIVVATGAAESAVAFPGWTLPGVMTVGAAQILINRERVYPGKAALIIGSSDMSLEIARQMHEAGIRIAGVVEAGANSKAQDKKIIQAFQETGIPLFCQTDVVSAIGSAKVEKVLLFSRATNSTEEYAVDCVCLDGGRHPVLEVLSILQCQLRYEEGLGGWLPCYKANMKSSVKGIFVAGQTAGVTCSPGVFLTGAIAGIGAVDFLEDRPAPEREAARRSCWDELERIETAKVPAVWQARMFHLKACLNEIAV